MIAWWSGLSWSHAAIVLLLLPLILAGAFAWLLSPRPEAPSTRRKDSSPWPLVDYSAQYRRKVALLGSRYLLARPINRRVEG